MRSEKKRQLEEEKWLVWYRLIYPWLYSDQKSFFVFKSREE